VSGPGGSGRRATRAAPLVALLAGLAATAPLSALAQPAAAAADSTARGALPEREYFLLQADRRPLILAHGAVDPASFVLRVGGERWQIDRDFALRARSGQVVPLREWSAGGPVIAVIEYRFQPGLGESRVALRPMAPAPPRRSGAIGARRAAAARSARRRPPPKPGTSTSPVTSTCAAARRCTSRPARGAS